MAVLGGIMSNSRRRSRRKDTWNPSHETRFTSDAQPGRSRGPNKIKLERNIARLLAASLNETVTVTVGGKPTKMTNAQYLVLSVVKDLQKSSAAEKLKAMNYLYRWGLIDDLDEEDGIVAELMDQLEDEKEACKTERHFRELAEYTAEDVMTVALDLLSKAEALLANCTCEGNEDSTALQRGIAEMSLELGSTLRAKARRSEGARRPGESGVEAFDRYLRETVADMDDDEQAREALRKEWDEEEPPLPSPSSGEIDPDDDFYSGMLGND